MKLSMPPWPMSRGNGSEPDSALDRLEALDSQLAELRRGELERISSLTAEEAKRMLLEEVEADARRQAGLALRKIEEETRREADQRARGILATATQRLAGPHAERTTTQLVHLPSDRMKGRIIGREGRNIQALEQLTGVDIIVDDTPRAVRLSSFDGMRRETARLTLDRLVADGRIHPARCEEAFGQAQAEIEERVVEEGERAALDANVNGLHPHLIDLLGRLQFRTSYGQNVLAHLIESSYLAGLIAVELGAAADIARRAALLHDVGKAVDQEVEGTHARIGARLATRFGESEAVAHAIAAHHDEVEPNSVEAVVVQTADALSGARPGARGHSLEEYVARLSELEQLASRHSGVEKVYAMQAGREMRVIVDPGAVDDEGAALISHEIAASIEREVTYPGQIKITVIRESRATNYAR
ncbi:MAG TPA: ribonuclease Y [Solirubrobacterales bacterium]|nr:ribonuclease Y [Solirubrobacterales bacterium]